MERELDQDICDCIIEFLLRESADEMLLKKLIAAFPPLNPTPRLKKAVLLRSIQREITAGSVPEKLLDSLEMIECIDTNQRLPIPDSMRKAYCAVALECTAKYLSGDPNPNGLYSDAVNRIWRGRIEDLEKSKASDLVSERLRNLRRQVEAAFGDEEVAKRLPRRGRRSLKEHAWGSQWEKVEVLQKDASSGIFSARGSRASRTGSLSGPRSGGPIPTIEHERYITWTALMKLLMPSEANVSGTRSRAIFHSSQKSIYTRRVCVAINIVVAERKKGSLNQA
ncbi:hypothetical protein V6N13_068557 [Hibiscus sabdariffa]|uniref:Uncharacterized protein n=1 Tax=Hibiscus sabdariffa TaxID=183260 RepID=A0ABR2QMZ0_9ROSI